MGRFVCFWNGTKLMVVLFLTGCASMMASVQYPQPSKFVLQGGKLKPAPEDQKKDVFSTYCSGGKQIKSLTINFSFVLPKNPQGWSIDDAGSYQKNLNQQRQCLTRKILYRLAESPDCQTYYGNYLTDLRGKKLCAPANRDEPVWFLSSSLLSSEIEKSITTIKPTEKYDSTAPVFVRSKDGRLYGFYFIGSGSGIPNVLDAAPKMFGDELLSMNSSDLATLTQNFTILEPLDFQNKAYTEEIEKQSDDETDKSCDPHKMYGAESVTFFKDEKWETVEAYAIGEDGNANISKALYQRNKIWERYISRFSTVKESVDSANTNKINTQVSLDLNGFCRYGRSTDDLTSK